ncbi:lysis protein [Pseudomonas sp. GD04087]|uniref:lysis protein n=1 Tax=unclassified Pseudomonas TaxID=196821 RepID=UPI0024471933|nr:MULTISPECIES: lysis protein [unclassified Pseudomonas]MDH0290598.1 lysis protein [Pseudomonas sp. GD04087]MDH1051515.1 lysis protein [Pseudomonas sp. GD03903]MDH2002758.1 lysis protein [Pseudomonas sp. GD03691]
MAVLSWLRAFWPVLAVGAFTLILIVNGQGRYDDGFEKAKVEGDKALADLREQYANERAQVAQDNLLQYTQQVTRANQAEERLLGAQDQIASLQHQLSERIAHVSTQYRPAPGAAPVPAPRFVVTCGWLRDYNLALGADLSAPAACRTASTAEKAAWPAPGSDAELLESGVSAADILAHARDYGAWALTNLVQLNGLLDLHNKESR